MNTTRIVSAFLLALLTLTTSTHAALEQGVVSSYSFDADFTDLLGNNHAANTGGAISATRALIGNGSVVFSVNGQYVSAAANNYAGFGDFSVIQWVNVTSVDTYDNTLFIGDGSQNLQTIFNLGSGSCLGAGTNSLCFATWNGTAANCGANFTPHLNTKTLIAITVNATSGNYTMYLNGAQACSYTRGRVTRPTSALYIGTQGNAPTRTMNGASDEVTIWNRTLAPAEIGQLYSNGTGIAYPYPIIGAPVIRGLNCTSCNLPFGSNTSPYVTPDTTPTFVFNTSVFSACRVGRQDLNYTAMGPTRNCTGGDGTLGHTCTLTNQDALPIDEGTMYIACKNTFDQQETTASTSGPLRIVGLANNDGDAIEVGVRHSVVWPGATIYRDQQVYLRDVNNNQLLTTVDRVVAYGNQRWLINADNQTTLGLFNITPVVYSLEMANISLLEMEDRVSAYINATKN